MELLNIIFLIPLGFGLFILYKHIYNKRFKNPEKVLKEVDIYLSDPAIPNRVAVQVLEQALNYNPKHSGLTNKLNEIKALNISGRAIGTHETLYLILFITIGIISIAQILLWLKGDTDLYGLTLGCLFIIGSLLTFGQYLKGRKSC